MPRSKVFKCALAACWLGTALSFTENSTIAGNVPGKDVAGCSRDKLSTMRSPDDSWVAFVQEEVRGDGGYVTPVDDIVR